MLFITIILLFIIFIYVVIEVFMCIFGFINVLYSICLGKTLVYIYIIVFYLCVYFICLLLICYVCYLLLFSVY